MHEQKTEKEYYGLLYKKSGKVSKAIAHEIYNNYTIINTGFKVVSPISVHMVCHRRERAMAGAME